MSQETSRHETAVRRAPAPPGVPLLQLPPEARQRLTALVIQGYPHETCGLLLGHGSPGCTNVVHVLAARNLEPHRAHDRYTLDPHDFLRADRQATEAGLEIVGIWHSHPDHPARPSSTDRAAAWEGYSYVIARVTAAGVEDIRSWRLQGNAFVEEVMTWRAT